MSNLLHAIAGATVAELVLPAAKTSTVTSTGIDVSAYEGSLLVILHSAAGTGTTPTLNGKLQDSDAVGGTYADVPGATFVEIDDTAGGSIQAIAVDLGNVNGFLRFVGTIAGTTPSFTMGVSVVGLKKYQP